jgi:hypothetical protein
MTFGRQSIEQRQAQRAAQKAANLGALMNVRSSRVGVYAGTTAAPAPKDNPLRSEPYRRLVAAMPCCICGVEGVGQAAHPNTGKGMAMKTDDRLAFSLCGPRVGEVGCHSKFDQGGLFTKEERRAFEVFAGRMTRLLLTKQGLWPQGLPTLEEV